MQPHEEGKIIRKIKDGEIEYFSYIVHAYTDQILNYVRSKLYEKNDAEDIVQEVFLHFYKKIGTFDEKYPVLPYLFGIAKNELKMYYRAKKTTVPLDENVTAAAEETDVDIEEAVKTLSPNQRKPLKLLYEGYTYEEIAKKLGKSINTVKTIIRRSRLKLKKNHEKT